MHSPDLRKCAADGHGCVLFTLEAEDAIVLKHAALAIRVGVAHHGRQRDLAVDGEGDLDRPPEPFCK